MVKFYRITELAVQIHEEIDENDITYGMGLHQVWIPIGYK